MSADLKPCPFCGSEPHMQSIPRAASVVCNGCGASSDLYNTHAEAEAAWNARKESP